MGGGITKVTAPAIGATVLTVGRANPANVPRAALTSQSAWDATAALKRSKTLYRAADILIANPDDILR